MWHLFSDDRPWFAAKRFGYGAGMPIAWQGWALLLSYVLALIGLGFLAERLQGEALAWLILAMVLLTIALVVVARARTSREWRWRWGEDD